ncbi:hypothetical protein [Paraburkholderia caribensis]|uniref:hypothetical protein n=1 Tax=Paraburkholderia caribensis TaxID=75105 RepID=UPI002859AE2B|nr:hypothetical protein [Paraburkholderia caribensis]MDR6384254.1 hypothetical protein [Paraburkholderia caribensis]
MSTSIKPIPFAELVLRNQCLHDAGKVAFETVQRYERNIKKIRALAHSITRMDADDLERPHLLSALNDAIRHTELEISAEMPLLSVLLSRGNGMDDSESASIATMH